MKTFEFEYGAKRYRFRIGDNYGFLESFDGDQWFSVIRGPLPTPCDKGIAALLARIERDNELWRELMEEARVLKSCLIDDRVRKNAESKLDVLAARWEAK